MHLLKIVLYKIKAFGGSIKKILQQKKRLFTPKFLTSQLITCQFFFVLIKDWRDKQLLIKTRHISQNNTLWATRWEFFFFFNQKAPYSTLEVNV